MIPSRSHIDLRYGAIYFRVTTSVDIYRTQSYAYGAIYFRVLTPVDIYRTQSYAYGAIYFKV